MRIRNSAALIFALFTAVHPATATPFPADRLTSFQFPAEFGSIHKDLYDYRSGDLVAVLVENVASPDAWTVVQKRGTTYSHTVFNNAVTGVALLVSGVLAETATTSGSRVTVLNGTGDAIWSREIGSGNARPSVDGTQVVVSNAGEGDETTAPSYVRLYSVADGSLIGDFEFGQRLTGAFASGSGAVFVAFNGTVQKVEDGGVVWSSTFAEGTVALAAMGEQHLAVSHPLGRTRILSAAAGTLVYDFNPPVIASSLLPLTPAFLRQLRPFYVPQTSKVIFFDSVNFLGTLVELDLQSGNLAARSRVVAYPANTRPSRQLYGGEIGWVLDNRLTFLSVR